MRSSLLLFISAPAFAAGLWLKQIAPLPAWADFAILKTAIFHPSGKVVPTRPSACPGDGTWHAWITHRVSEKDVFTREGGEKTGSAISKILTCEKAVEIDLEPLPRFLDEHRAFFAGMRSKLSIPLRLAIYPGWPREDLVRALEVVDGIDFMVYDTAAKKAEDYETVLRATLGVAKEFPNKTILIGLPAYTHGLKGRHDRRVENLTVASKAWTCGPDFAVYAGWTMTEEESRQAAALVKKCHP